jgi:ribosomal protein S18 acetylase RimI-like enzyme
MPLHLLRLSAVVPVTVATLACGFTTTRAVFAMPQNGCAVHDGVVVHGARGGHFEIALHGYRDGVVGFALSTPGTLLGEYLRILVVDGAHRLQGVGRKLMEALEQRAFRSSPNVYLCVSDFNRTARQFYRRLGYEEIGLLKDLLIPGRDEVLMRKSIAAWRGFVGSAGTGGTT